MLNFITNFLSFYRIAFKPLSIKNTKLIFPAVHILECLIYIKSYLNQYDTIKNMYEYNQKNVYTTKTTRNIIDVFRFIIIFIIKILTRKLQLNFHQSKYKQHCLFTCQLTRVYVIFVVTFANF